MTKPKWIKINTHPKGQVFKCPICEKTCYCVKLDKDTKHTYCDYKFCPRCGKVVQE